MFKATQIRRLLASLLTLSQMPSDNFDTSNTLTTINTHFIIPWATILIFQAHFLTLGKRYTHGYLVYFVLQVYK